MRVVIASVNYADYLADTLPAWRRVLPKNARIVVVTSPEDEATQAVARAEQASICMTSIWRQNGATFNIAGAMDLAFGFAGTWTTPPSDREACLSIDADIYPLGQFPDRGDLRTWNLYGAPRHRCVTRSEFLDFQQGRKPLSDFPIILQRRRKSEPADGDETDRTRAARACLGYFQLFRYRPGISFGESKGAGGYDLRFRQHFERRVALKDFAVLHLGPLNRKNWRGRVLPSWNAEPEAVPA